MFAILGRRFIPAPLFLLTQLSGMHNFWQRGSFSACFILGGVCDDF